MELNNNYSFQCDSSIIKSVYLNQKNYLIEYNNSSRNDLCAIYFSSNDLYYPNNESAFYERIIKNNHYEWYNTRINNVHKHIFIRDIFKQWYLSGINSEINSIEKLTEFLKTETYGYDIICIGSSAGGYASILIGSFLKANKIITFNPQFEIKSLLKSSNNITNPLIHRLENTPSSIFFDINKFINKTSDIFYFYSNRSSWDISQFIHSKKVENIHHISFNTKHHGIPFLKVALNNTINLDTNQLIALQYKNQNPLIFTIMQVGIIKTIHGLYKQIKKFIYNKLTIYKNATI